MNFLDKHQPTERQQLFHDCEATEALFGGGSGAGATFALLADFAYQERKHGRLATGILFRRTFGEFMHVREAANVLYGKSATWNHPGRKYVWPSGAALQLDWLEDTGDPNRTEEQLQRHMARFQGYQFTWQGWDHLTEWKTPFRYLWMFSCLRPPHHDVKCLVRASGIPCRAGSAWVYDRFINTTSPGSIWTGEDGITRCYIRATLDDNPYLMEYNPDYEKRMFDGADQQVAAALRHGRWDTPTPPWAR